MRVQNAKELLNMSRYPLFQSQLTSISCLVTITEADNDEELMRLLEMFNIILAKKFLLLTVSAFDTIRFSNRTINYQVTIHHKKTG